MFEHELAAIEARKATCGKEPIESEWMRYRFTWQCGSGCCTSLGEVLAIARLLLEENARLRSLFGDVRLDNSTLEAAHAQGVHEERMRCATVVGERKHAGSVATHTLLTAITECIRDPALSLADVVADSIKEEIVGAPIGETFAAGDDSSEDAGPEGDPVAPMRTNVLSAAGPYTPADPGLWATAYNGGPARPAWNGVDPPESESLTP